MGKCDLPVSDQLFADIEQKVGLKQIQFDKICSFWTKSQSEQVNRIFPLQTSPFSHWHLKNFYGMV